MNYRLLLEHSFDVSKRMDECPPRGRLDYLSQHIFDFTTYDSAVDELFAGKAVEVCNAITNRTTFEYIETEEGNLWYLLMCNMPFFYPRLDWGTSIRGAWWGNGAITFQSCGLYVEEDQLSEPLTFSHDEWESFMRAVVEFATLERVAEEESGRREGV